MPRRLTGVGRRKTRTLADMDIVQYLDFEVGWDTPEEQWDKAVAQVPEWDDPVTREAFIAGEKSRSPWATREEYLADYDAVRDELLAGRWSADISDWAAEQLWQEAENR